MSVRLLLLASPFATGAGGRFASPLLRCWRCPPAWRSGRGLQAPQRRCKFDFSRSPAELQRARTADRSRPRAKTSTDRAKTTMLYVVSLAVATAGASYAAVPLYRIFCTSTGYGGTVAEGHDADKVETMTAAKNRPLHIYFNADRAATMRWNFKPQQPVIRVYPGETALAFYSAKNPTDKPIDGISTYNVVPFEAGPYFNKIQCFCFEEQRLNPGEEVDMPVFFYIDPDFMDDPFLENVDEITLSYTFFESKPGLQLPQPYGAQPKK